MKKLDVIQMENVNGGDLEDALCIYGMGTSGLLIGGALAFLSGGLSIAFTVGWWYLGSWVC